MHRYKRHLTAHQIHYIFCLKLTICCIKLLIKIAAHLKQFIVKTFEKQTREPAKFFDIGRLLKKTYPK